MCLQKGCKSYRKSIRRDQIERDYEELLTTITPPKSSLAVAAQMFRSIWDARLKTAKADKKRLDKDFREIETLITSYLDRLVETENRTIAAALERKITALETQKLVLEERAAGTGQPTAPF